VARADRPEPVAPRALLETFPMRLGEWTGVLEPPFTKRELEVLNLDDYLTRAYYAPNRIVNGLYIGYWQSQRQGSAIHSPQNCLPAAGWQPTSQSIIRIPDTRRTDGSTVEANRYVIQKGLDKVLVFYWYQSHGRIVASEYWSKIFLVTDAVRLNRTDAAIVRLTVPIDSRQPDGEQRSERDALAFAAVLLPKLDAYIPN
jgi:EpsI family protein